MHFDFRFFFFFLIERRDNCKDDRQQNQIDSEGNAALDAKYTHNHSTTHVANCQEDHAEENISGHVFFTFSNDAYVDADV